jgi:hypothetical protein
VNDEILDSISREIAGDLTPNQQAAVDGEGGMFEPDKLDDEWVCFVENVAGRHLPVEAGIHICAGWSSEDGTTKSIFIDTTKRTGPVRIFLNDGLIYEGDPV